MARALAWQTKYEADEIALGIALAIALHAIPIAALVIKAAFPSNDAAEEALVAKPVVAAELLKLGKPLDPKKLPDRIVPKQSTAPKKDVVASREDPSKRNPDAGVPPPNAQESDITKLVAKSDPFAEDAGKERPEEGFANGSDAGTETDPSKVHAGDMYALQIQKFLKDRWTFPTVISEGEAHKLCTVVQINIDRRMVIWHMRSEPIKKSGNDLFDDSARATVQKLMDDRTPLPEPPKEVEELWRGRTINIGMGDACH